MSSFLKHIRFDMFPPATYWKYDDSRRIADMIRHNKLQKAKVSVHAVARRDSLIAGYVDFQRFMAE